MRGTREIFEDFRRQVCAGGAGLTEANLAADAVVETPFAAPGQPSRWEGAAEWAAFAGPARAGLPIRIDGMSDVVFHETADPEVAVVEYRLSATHEPSGWSGSAPFILVMRVRDGRVVLWREYQNPLAMAGLTAAG